MRGAGMKRRTTQDAARGGRQSQPHRANKTGSKRIRAEPPETDPSPPTNPDAANMPCSLQTADARA